jgi:peptidyl-tRNA hydrolase, PTH1 family
MPHSKYKLIAGLGNPGREYTRTRHNIGFLVLEALAAKSCLKFDKSHFNSEYIKTKLRGEEVFLVKPLTYMNRSGIPIHRFASFYKIPIHDIIIIHDDMDLDFGKVKIVKNRGAGGHKGVLSIIENFGKKDFIRIRLGVGHPNAGKNVTGHVLGGFSPEESLILEKILKTASEACLNILNKGLTSAMNSFNRE